jgi:CspA family cold shock protein
MKGTIEKKMEKGYGFITPDGGGKGIFFHSNSLVGVAFDDLNEGEAVTFEVEDSEKGKNAVNVERAA